MRFWVQSFFTIILLTFSFSNLVFAQTSETDQLPEVIVKEIILDNVSYSASGEINGEVVLKNKRSYEANDVYFSNSIIGSDDEENDNFFTFKTYNEDGNIYGPYVISGNAEIRIPFTYKLPDYKLTKVTAFKIQALLSDGYKLGSNANKFSFDTEVLGKITVSNFKIVASENEFSQTQIPTIYDGEKSEVKYELINDSDKDVKVRPQITIKDKRDIDVVLAKYNEQTIVIEKGDSVSLSHLLKTFDYDPGIYVAKIDLIDDSDRKIAESIDFTYIIDGLIAKIDSIVVDYEDGKSVYGTVFVNYKGQPLDIRNPKFGQEIKDVNVEIISKSLSGKEIKRENHTVNLSFRGQLELPLNVKRGFNPFNVEVIFSKDGTVLDKKQIEVSETNDQLEKIINLGFALLALVVTILILIIYRKHKHKLGALSIIILFALFGFANNADALTIVDTYGPEELMPESINIYDSSDYSGGTYIGDDTSITVSLTPVELYGYNQGVWVHSAYNGQSGSSPSGANCHSPSCGGAGAYGPYWYDLQSVPDLFSACDDASCVEGNLDEEFGVNEAFYQIGENSHESTFASPDEVGEYRLYFYITIYNYTDALNAETPDENTVYILAYEDVSIVDPYVEDNQAYCDGQVESINGDNVDIVWSWHPGVCYNELLGGTPPGSTEPCTRSSGTIDNLSGLTVRWSGDIDGDSATGGGLYSLSAMQIPSGLEDADLYCEGVYGTGAYYCSDNDACCINEMTQVCTNDCSYECGFWNEFGECEFEFEQCTESCEYMEAPVAKNYLGFKLWGGSYAGQDASIKETYNINDLDDGIANVFFRYQYFDTGTNDWRNDSDWYSLECRPIDLSEIDADLCANISGVQFEIPAGFDVYPDPGLVGTDGITYDDLYCYPAILAEQGSLSFVGDPSLSPLDGVVNWTYTLSDNYFQGIFDGVLYQIPRIATVTWTGDISTSAQSDGVPGTSQSTFQLTDPSDLLSVLYNTPGSAEVTIEIEDPYLYLSGNDLVTIQDENGCPGGVDCDVEVNPPAIDSFTIDPSIVNTGEYCYLSWATSVDTTACTLITQSGEESVDTSSEGYAVSPGQYSISCQNGAEEPETALAGPLTCLLNPNVKER